MAVRPVGFDPTGGISALHDELGHGGAVAFADVAFGRAGDGSLDADHLLLVCPVCGAVSAHPITGGCDPVRVQLLFWRTIRRRAALGALNIPAGQRTSAAVKQRIHDRVAALEGEARWRLEALGGEDDPVDQL